MIGAIFSGYIAERYGRKWPSIVTLIPYSLGWALMIKPVNYEMMLAGQMLCGFFQGMRAPIGRMYMAEASHPLYRGEFLTSITMLVMASSLASYVAALFLNWQHLAILSGVIPLIMIPVIMVLPESHAWLISKGRHDEARESWRWFRGGKYCDAVGDEEFRDSITHYEETKEAVNSWRDILQFHYLKPVIIIVVSLLLRHFCGNTAIMFFMSQIFTMSKSGVQPKYAVIILGFIQLFFIIVSGRMMDRIGRRKSTVISSIIMGFSQICMGAYFYFDESPELRATAERFNWLPLVFLSTCMIGYSLGIASIAIILSGEIVPIQIKNSTNGIINFFNKGFAFVALETFRFFLVGMNASGTFWLYAACCFVLALYFLLVLPETRGQTLQDIEKKLTERRKSSSDGSLSSVSTVVTLSLPSGIVEDEKANSRQRVTTPEVNHVAASPHV